MTSVTWHPVKGKCRICGKPDWCTVASNGASCCMRVESKTPMRNGGWLHLTDALQAAPVKVAKDPESPTIDAAALMSEWTRATLPQARRAFASTLGVSEQAVGALDAAWASPHAAWAFPMRDGQGSIVGIRLRNSQGLKWAVKGSHQGVFVPSMDPVKTAYIPEGPTDTAAALSLGLFAIGRPSCSAGAAALQGNCVRLGIRRLVLVADNDDPGLKGAASVAHKVGLPWVAILPPFGKDLRAYVKMGGTAQLLESVVTQQVWNQS